MRSLIRYFSAWITGRTKKLYDYQPHELSLDLLLTLQQSLIAKLILVNRDLINRYQNLAALSGELPSNSGVEKSCKVLSEEVRRLQPITELLEDELARISSDQGDTNGYQSTS